MSKFLIVTDSFTPDFSPRVSFLVKNLKKAGHTVCVLAEDVENPFYNVKIDNVEVHRDKFYTSVPGTLSRKIEWTVKTALNLLIDFKSCYFYCKWRNVASDCDAVICSTFCYFPLKPAYKLARRMGVPFIADVRDLAEQFVGYEYQMHSIPFFSKLFDRIQRCRRNCYVKRASVITTVSPWHKEFLERYNSNVSLIYNGYDEMFGFSEVKSDTFDIIYTGKWLGCDMQDPKLLFDAIEELTAEDKLPQEKIRLLWYLSKGKEEMQSLLESYSTCKQISSFCQRVQYSEIPSLLLKSSVVLVLTNKYADKGPKGIITTKFFEALGCEKPVLNVTADGKYLTSIITETKAGLSTASLSEVKDFLLEKYSEWSSAGFTHQKVDAASRQRFNRSNQAKEFEEIFLKNI